MTLIKTIIRLPCSEVGVSRLLAAPGGENKLVHSIKTEKKKRFEMSQQEELRS